MVKLKGPGMASTAAGGLGKVLIFSQSKGRAYAKKWTKPANPKSPAQIAMRVVTQYISLQWFNLPQADRDSWTTLATQLNVPPMTACIGWNTARARSGIYPATLWPGASVNAPQTWLSWVITVQPRSLLHVFGYWAKPTGRGWVVHRAEGAPVLRAWNNFVKFVEAGQVSGVTWWNDHLDPGTYYYQARRISNDGRAIGPQNLGPYVVT